MRMRDVVVLDTETTGLNDKQDRIIEIGAIKLQGGRPVSKFHAYVNAQGVESSPAALAVHGITEKFLQDKPIFEDVYMALLAFISDVDLVIHNAPFDVGFLNAELERVNYSARVGDICHVVDTYVMAKQKFPGQKNNLDALCKRFGIANAHRTLHGALLDADLLAKVYLQMSMDQSDILQETEALASPGTLVGEERWQAPVAMLEASAIEVEADAAFFDHVS